ncbi:MAG: HNH endonuclease [Elainellaceae cyanobacterium]
MIENDFEALTFELKDKDIFRIPDIQTRLNTLQNYFFPRLEILLKQSLEEVQKIYDINPYEKMIPVYRPSHRKNAKVNSDYGNVYIGISGKRNQQELIYKKKSGKYAKIHISYLTYSIYPDGSFLVAFSPFEGCVREGDDYIENISLSLEACRGKIEKIFIENGISYTLSHNLCYENFIDAISRSPEEDEYCSRHLLCFFSPTYYFPVSRNTGLWELKRAFVALYPILDNFITIAKGEQYPLETMLDKLINHYLDQGWYWSRRKEFVNDSQISTKIQEDFELPELDSYRFIRTGLWWEILARDQWTCCSCGRSSKEHGTTLHVDHIIPRSMGGTDNKENLQTLCWKCNIGKSNRDTTDLRVGGDRF